MSLEHAAILISTRNRTAFLARTLAELQRIGVGDADLWVYDDQSDDPAAVRGVLAAWPGAHCVIGEQRVGQAEGRNVLLRLCGKAFAILLDDDQYFSDLGPLQEYLEAAPASTPPAVVGFQSVRVGDGVKAIPWDGARGDASTFMGGASLFHVPSVLSVGGYRRFFVYGWEEPELAMRLWLRGFAIRFDSRVVVAHNHRMTPDASRDLREYDYLYARNIVLTHTLNLSLVPALVLGGLRALRFGMGAGRHRVAVAHGLVAGVIQTFSRWADRTPFPYRRYREWRRYVERCARGGATVPAGGQT